MSSIFSLSRIKDEPYLTQVFSYLLDSDRKFCSFLLNNIFALTSTGEVLRIVPEVSVEAGRPDIVINCANACIAIENKIGAAFRKDQIKDYQKEFDYVFLIYKYLSDPNQASFATKSFTWYHIYSETKRYIKSFSNSYDVINRYLLKQFILFLEETDMGIGKVGWEIVNGTKSLLSLFAQITGAFENLKSAKEITYYRAASSNPTYNGWQVTIDKDSFYVYVFYWPLLVFSYFEDEKDRSSEYKPLVKIHPELVGWRKAWHLGTFNISTSNFLCLSADEQIETILEFIRLSKQKCFRQ